MGLGVRQVTSRGLRAGPGPARPRRGAGRNRARSRTSARCTRASRRPRGAASSRRPRRERPCGRPPRRQGPSARRPCRAVPAVVVARHRPSVVHGVDARGHAAVRTHAFRRISRAGSAEFWAAVRPVAAMSASTSAGRPRTGEVRQPDGTVAHAACGGVPVHVRRQVVHSGHVDRRCDLLVGVDSARASVVAQGVRGGPADLLQTGASMSRSAAGRSSSGRPGSSGIEAAVAWTAIFMTPGVEPPVGGSSRREARRECRCQWRLGACAHGTLQGHS